LLIMLESSVVDRECVRHVAWPKRFPHAPSFTNDQANSCHPRQTDLAFIPLTSPLIGPKLRLRKKQFIRGKIRWRPMGAWRREGI
jgi:hypothetical protein